MPFCRLQAISLKAQKGTFFAVESDALKSAEKGSFFAVGSGVVKSAKKVPF